MKINYAHVAYQDQEKDSILVYHLVGYETMPIEVDLENFVADIKTNPAIGLIDQEFLVGTFSGKDLEHILQNIEKANAEN